GVSKAAKPLIKLEPSLSEQNFSTSHPNFQHYLSMTWRCLLVLITIHCAFTSATPKDDPLSLSQPLTVAWRYQTDHTTDLTPAADMGNVYVPLGAGVLVALNAVDGKLRWKMEAGGEFSAAPLADDRSVYVATSYAQPDEKHVQGTLRAISKSTGVTL